MVFIVRQPAAGVVEADNNIPVDADAESVEDTVEVPEEAGDDQDQVVEQDDQVEGELPIGGLEDLQPDDSIQNDVDDSNNDQNLDDDDETIDEPDRNPEGSHAEPTVRRSTRHKTSTAVTKYKDFHVPPISKGAQQSDWMVRANYLRSAISSGAFDNVRDNVSNALLKLITSSDQYT